MTAVASLADRPAADRSIVLELARIEAVRFLLHPAFLVGCAASGLVAWRAVAEDAQAAWAGEGYQSGLLAWAFAGLGTLIAAALATARGRLLDDVEVFAGVPLPPSRRILALAIALLGPAGIVAVGVAIEAQFVASRGGFRQADPPFSTGLVPVSLLEWAHLPLVVLFAGVVGIVVGALPRARAVALVVVTSIGVIVSAAYWAFMATPLQALHPLVFATSAHDLPASFSPSTWTRERGLLAPDQYETLWREVRTNHALLQWHVLGLVGLCVAGVGIAMRLVDRDERRGLPIAGVGAAIGVLSIAAQVAVGS